MRNKKFRTMDIQGMKEPTTINYYYNIPYHNAKVCTASTIKKS